MKITISISDKKIAQSHIIILTEPLNENHFDLKEDELKYCKKRFNQDDVRLFDFFRKEEWIFVIIPEKKDSRPQCLESMRKWGDKLQDLLNKKKIDETIISGSPGSSELISSFVEGMVLGNYQFGKYKTENNKAHWLKSVLIEKGLIEEHELNTLNSILESVCFCRDLVNEPVSFLTAPKMAEIISKAAVEAGIKAEVLNKKKIESLKMGGILAVNKGSIDSPTFTILEWKPARTINKRPYILVGKGVVYDTGGMNIKTGKFMENMKSDMSGAASVAAIMLALAKTNTPLHMIALIPATDNRLNGNAYVSGDVVKMYDGTTVEIINTDAEGRMILADALSYAKKYDPELVVNIATLTGSAQRAIGSLAIAAMQNSASDYYGRLKDSGDRVYERLVEFPLWEEYAENIKSDIADIKNIGGSSAGMITAGKFLQHFTAYPFIHLDIAGTAFNETKDSYRGKGATGSTVRLLTDFFLNLK